MLFGGLQAIIHRGWWWCSWFDVQKKKGEQSPRWLLDNSMQINPTGFQCHLDSCISSVQDISPQYGHGKLLIDYYSTAVTPSTFLIASPGTQSLLSVFWTDEIGKGFWLSLIVVHTISVCVVAVVIVSVGVLGRAKIFHLQDVATFRASLDRAVAGHCEPDGVVRVSGVAGTASILLITEALDDNWVVQRAFARGIQWLHVEDINALHLSQNLQSLQPSRLLEIRWHGADCCSRTDEVFLRLDLVKFLDLDLVRTAGRCRGGFSAYERACEAALDHGGHCRTTGGSEGGS